MKKIVSLLLVMLMIFSFASISLAADECNVLIKRSAISEDNKLDVTFEINLSSELSLMSTEFILKYDKSALKVDSYSMDGGVDWATSNSNMDYDKAQAYFAFEDSNYAGSTTSSQFNISIKFSVLDADTAKHAFSVTTLAFVDSDWNTVEPTYTVKEDSSKPSNIITKTGSLADTGVINNLTVMDDKGTTTKGFIGAAVGFQFVTPADITLDDNMIWALTTANGKLYSPKFNAGLSALGKNATVTVAATLTTGVNETNTEITAVNGIFKDAASDTFYYTDAADKPAE